MEIPRRVSAPLFVVFLTIALNGVRTEVTRAQEPRLATLQGRVISRAGMPIAEAEVTLTGTDATVLTDSSGRFLLRGITPGLVVLRVRRIGFKGQFLRVTLGPGTFPATEIMLDPGPQLLPEITVSTREAKPLEFAWTTKYDDFFRRRWLGLPGGTFISAEDIKRRTAIHTAELIGQYVPGVRVLVHFLGEGGTEIQFPRCSRAVGYVGVWVDGRMMNFVQQQYQEAPGIRSPSTIVSEARPSKSEIAAARKRAAELADVLDLIPPNEIQFMEVYRGIGSIPGVYSGGCGAVVIWTK